MTMKNTTVRLQVAFLLEYFKGSSNGGFVPFVAIFVLDHPNVLLDSRVKHRKSRQE